MEASWVVVHLVAAVKVVVVKAMAQRAAACLVASAMEGLEGGEGSAPRKTLLTVLIDVAGGPPRGT